MAQLAIADGITHIIATPHANPRYSFDPKTIAERRAQLEQAIGNQLRLAAGCDFHLSPENLRQLLHEPTAFTLNRSRYLLLELSDFAIPPSFEQILYELQQAGLCPILTHPERNRLLRHATERLDDWIHRGCLVQITAGALLGRFGPGAERAATHWVCSGRVHLVASDAHNTTTRPPGLRSAYQRVTEWVGEATAQALFANNPLAVFEDRSLPYWPEPAQRRPKTRFRFF